MTLTESQWMTLWETKTRLNEAIPVSYNTVRSLVIDHISSSGGCQAGELCHLTKKQYKINATCLGTLQSQVQSSVVAAKSLNVSKGMPTISVASQNHIVTPAPAVKKPGARQNHGFVNEKRVIEKHNLVPSESYTAHWDAHARVTGIPVSIKTKCNYGSVEMGDFWRQASVGENFYLHVSFWEGTDHTVVKEYILLMPYEVWNSFFPAECNEDIKSLIQDASNDYSYDEEWKRRCKIVKDKWEALGSIIKLAPKRDHKSQKRMQCILPYDEFMKLYKIYGVPYIK